MNFFNLLFYVKQLGLWGELIKFANVHGVEPCWKRELSIITYEYQNPGTDRHYL